MELPAYVSALYFFLQARLLEMSSAYLVTAGGNEIDEEGLSILRGTNERAKKSMYVYDENAASQPYSMGLTKAELKEELRRLSNFAKEKNMNKNYGDISLEYRKHSKYLFGRNVVGILSVTARRKPPCVMCKSKKVDTVFFPCRHACVCEECQDLHNIGTNDKQGMTAWRACPVCMDEIKKVLPMEPDVEQKYWSWVYEVKPPIPWIDRGKFSRAAEKLKHGTIPGRENHSIIAIEAGEGGGNFSARDTPGGNCCIVQ